MSEVEQAIERSRRQDVDFSKRSAVVQTAEDAELLAEEIDRLNTWAGLMWLLDKRYPADVFDGSGGDPGPQTIALIREVDRLQSEAPKCPLIHTPCGACGCAIRDDGLCGCEDNRLHGIAHHYGDHLSEARAENERLQAIVDALPKCWRLKDGELVQDVPVVPGMPIWVEYGGRIEPDRAWQFYQHRFSGEPIQWFVLLRRGGVPIGDCYNSPEAAEHAAKAKGSDS